MKNRGVVKAGIINEILSLGVRLERGNWGKQKTVIRATGNETLEAIDTWLNRKLDLKIGMIEHTCEMICKWKLLFVVEI
jgi:hypothetical protein